MPGQASQHDSREDADRGRGGDDGQAVAAEHLPEEDGERCEQDGRQHEAVPEQLETEPAPLKRLKTSALALRRMFG
jgi:hypothetical protein